MSLRRERKHECGNTNIDFRTKRETENIKLYEPWAIPKNFGTMGRYGFYPSYTEMKRIFSVSQNNKIKDIIQQSPNPKEYPMTLFYKRNHIKPNTMSQFNVERFAQLDESYAGKERFTGDSMMISDINKYRKERKKKRRDLIEQKRIEKLKLKEKIDRDKREKNKEAYQETQLVNIEAEETLEGKVDIKKLYEIRLALRRRYANRTNFRKIFKEWDHSISGEISVYDAHEMINAFSIPINYNETRALIASSNKRETETLNLEEFMHLIFNDNNELKVNLKSLKFKDEKLFDEGAETENLKRNMKMNVIEMLKTDDLKYIMDHLHTRIPILERFINEEGIKGGICTKDNFKRILTKFNLTERYTRDNLIDAIFNNYNINNNPEYMDIGKFVDDCLKNVEENNFSSFKNRNIQAIEEKVKIRKEELKAFDFKLLEEQRKKEELKKDIFGQIVDKKVRKKLEEEEIEKNLKKIINTQPSTDFINQTFKDHYQCYQELNKVEESFSAHPSLLTELKAKTRFNANPKHKDTFYMINQDPKGSSHLNEKDRFSIIGPNAITSYIQKEREIQKLRQMEKWKRIQNYRDMNVKQMKFYQDLEDMRDVANLKKKTESLMDYEKFNKKRNEFVE